MTPEWEAFHIVQGVQNRICLVPSAGPAGLWPAFAMPAMKKALRLGQSMRWLRTY